MNSSPTTLHQLIRTSNLKLIEDYLTKDSKEINDFDPIRGWTPLYKAVLYRDFNLTRLLLEKGANPDIKNQIGETALQIAIENKLENIVGLLLEYKADVNMNSIDGEFPIHIACRTNSINILKSLLDYGANINYQNTLGKTCLHIILENNNIELIEFLLKNNADIDIKDKWGVSPSQMPMSKEAKDLFKRGKTPLGERIDNDNENIEVKESEKIEKNQINNLKKEIIDVDCKIKDLSKEIKELDKIEEKIDIIINDDENKENTNMSIKKDDYKVIPISIIAEGKSSVEPHEIMENITIIEKPIEKWLLEINLLNVLQNFKDNSIYENKSLINLLMSNSQNWDKFLITHFGIDKPGYRKRIITKLKEDLGLNKREGLFKLKNSKANLHFLDLEEWLKSLELEEWTPNFIMAGYDDYESLIYQMTTNNGITDRILEEEIMINDNLARIKIINQLIEDSMKASQIQAPEDFDGEISFEINSQAPGTWKETCVIF